MRHLISCPLCGPLGRAWTRRGAQLEQDLHRTVCQRRPVLERPCPPPPTDKRPNGSCAATQSATSDGDSTPGGETSCYWNDSSTNGTNTDL